MACAPMLPNEPTGLLNGFKQRLCLLAALC